MHCEYYRAFGEHLLWYTSKMTLFIGTLSEYDVNSDWDMYAEQLEALYSANEVPEDKKVPILLASIGQVGYKLLRDLCAPDLPKTKSYEQLVTLMGEHQKPKPMVSAERFRFFRVMQTDSDNVNEFVRKLKSAAEHCEFGDQLNNYLRDQFINGLKHENTQRHLLTVKDLTFTKATEIASSTETASKEVKKFR